MNKGRILLTIISICIAWSFPAVADDEKAARAAMDRGYKLFDASDLTGAREMFLRARELAPNRSGPYRQLAVTEAMLGNCREAITYFDEYLRRAPENDRRMKPAHALLDECRRKIAAELDAAARKEDERKAREAEEARLAAIEVDAKHGRARMRRTGWALGGTGGAVALIGVGFLIGAKLIENDFVNRYNQCFPMDNPTTMGCTDLSLLDLEARGRAFNIIGPIAIGSGILLSGLGAFLIWRGTEPHPGTKRTFTAVDPWFMPRGIGAVVRWEMP